MNDENGKHEFNFFLDKQLQQKLLEENEELLEKEFTGSLLQNNPHSGLQPPQSQSQSTNKNNVNSNSGAQQSHKLPKYLDCVHVCGWCPNPNTVYRKPESDAPPPRSRGSHLAATRDSLFSRDSKSRPQHVDNFVFRHYSDPRKYIEQYRKEHACYDSTNSSATKTEFLETRRFYAYNQYSPLAVGSNSNSGLHQPSSYVPQPQPDPPVQGNDTTSKSHQQQTPSLQYTNRREQKRSTISANLNAKNQHQYRLTKTPPNSNNKPDRVSDYTEEYIESLEVLKKQRHSGSAKERSSAIVNGLGIHKSATKINVPAANFGGKTLRTANTGTSSETALPSNHFPAPKSGHHTTGRMLDTLACVAGNGAGGDKQPQLPSLPNNNHNHNQVHSASSKPGTPTSKRRPSASTTNTTTVTTTTLVNDDNADDNDSHLRAVTTTPTASATMPLIPTPSATTTTTSLAAAAAAAAPAVSTPRVAFANDVDVINNKNNINEVNNLCDLTSSNHVRRSGNLLAHAQYNSKSSNKFKSKTNNEKDDDTSSTTSEVSIGQLSTTCLGADATVKSRPKLEASRTYHVFHNEFSSSSNQLHHQQHQHQHQQQPSQMLSVVWNPVKSAVVEKRPRPAHALNSLTSDMMMGMGGGPFRNSPRRPATEEGGYRAVEFVTKEFVQDTKPLNLRTTDVFRDVARMGIAANSTSTGGGGAGFGSVSPGLKTNTIKPDLPSSFSLHGVPKRPQFETLKKIKRASKTAVVRGGRKNDNNHQQHQHSSSAAEQLEGGRKSWSASTDASNNSTSGGGGGGGSTGLRLKPVHTDSSGNATSSGGNNNNNAANGGNSSSTSSSSLPMPYFKFWNSSLPPKSREGRRRGVGVGIGGGHGVDKMAAGDHIDMQELAEMVLADENRNDNADLADAAKRVLEFKSDAEQGIATGHSGLASPGHGSSKEELLESLRGVNQRPAKPSSRALHLSYYTGRDDDDAIASTTTSSTTSTATTTTNTVANIWSSNHHGHKNNSDDGGSGGGNGSGGGIRWSSSQTQPPSHHPYPLQQQQQQQPNTYQQLQSQPRSQSYRHRRRVNLNQQQKEYPRGKRSQRKELYNIKDVSWSSAIASSIISSSNCHNNNNQQDDYDDDELAITANAPSSTFTFTNDKGTELISQQSEAAITGNSKNINKSNTDIIGARSIYRRGSQQNDADAAIGFDPAVDTPLYSYTNSITTSATSASNSISNRRLHKQNHHLLEKEIVFFPEKDGVELLSSANEVGLNAEEPDFLSSLSDWKQIFVEFNNPYNYKNDNSASLIREAKNKELKNLIARKFDQKSSLAHQKRIKHLIEQSRLKSTVKGHLGTNLYRVHAKPDAEKEEEEGDESRLVDFKTGVPSGPFGNPRPDEDRRNHRYSTGSCSMNTNTNGCTTVGRRLFRPGADTDTDRLMKMKPSSQVKVITLALTNQQDLNNTSIMSMSANYNMNNCDSNHNGSSNSNSFTTSDHDHVVQLQHSHGRIQIETSPKSAVDTDRTSGGSLSSSNRKYHRDRCERSANRGEHDDVTSGTRTAASSSVSADATVGRDSIKIKRATVQTVHVVPCGIDPAVYTGCGVPGGPGADMQNTSTRLPSDDTVASYVADNAVVETNGTSYNKRSRNNNNNCLRDNAGEISLLINASDQQTTDLNFITISGIEHDQQSRPSLHRNNNDNKQDRRMAVSSNQTETREKNAANNNNNANEAAIQLSKRESNNNTNNGVKDKRLGFKIKGGKSCSLLSAAATDAAATSSNKPTTTLSPLSDTDIHVMAAKMAVKINMTKLKYTKSPDMERSYSMHL